MLRFGNKIKFKRFYLVNKLLFRVYYYNQMFRLIKVIGTLNNSVSFVSGFKEACLINNLIFTLDVKKRKSFFIFFLTANLAKLNSNELLRVSQSKKVCTQLFLK